MSLPSDSVLPPGSLILVTGVTGFVASLVADECAKYGFRVRGTARDPASDKASWMQGYFDEKYGKGKFEMVQVKALEEKGCLDDAVKDCDGIVHTTNIINFSPDPNEVITPSIAMLENALTAAAKTPSVKRFAYTSSSSAAQQWKWNEPYDLTPDCWDEVSIKAAWAPPPYSPERGLYCYNASKAQSEQAMWKFMQERKPQFVANSVLLDFTVGLPPDVEKQGYATSIGVLKELWEGGELWKMFYPQFTIDARDAALLHLAGLTKPDAKGERMFGYAWEKRWSDWFPMLREMYPEHSWPDSPENEGRDMANVTGRDRAEDALKWLGKSGWRPTKDSLKEVFDSIKAGSA